MGWWKTAKSGDKVVCIGEGEWVHPFWVTARSDGVPEVGKVYTIRDLIPDPRTVQGVAMMLEGYPDDCVFTVTLFRPVQPKSTETGMRILRKLLITTPVEEKV